MSNATMLFLIRCVKCLMFQIEQHQQNLEEMYGESIAEQGMLAARQQQTTRRLHSASVLSVALKDEMVLPFIFIKVCIIVLLIIESSKI